MFTLTDSAAPSGMTLLDYPAPAGRVIAGAFDDALETNPVPLFMMALELERAKAIGPRLSREDAAAEAARAGVSVKIPEDGLTEAALRILIERRKDAAARDLLFARGEGFWQGAGRFGAGVAGALLDPLNAAAGFIPVLSGTRYAVALAQAATATARAGLRTGIGAAEGLVGASLVELPTVALRRDLQDEYGLYDSLANIAFGTFASAGLRGVSGALRDRWRGLALARQEDARRAAEPPPQPQEAPQAAPAAAAAEPPGPAPIVVGERTLEAFTALAQEKLGAPPEIKGGPNVRDLTGKLAAKGIMQTDVEVPPGYVRFEYELSKSGKSYVIFGITPDGKRKRVSTLGGENITEREARLFVGALNAGGFSRVPIERVSIGPDTPKDVAAAISDETHAAALKTAVAQAVEGRVVDVEPVLKQDPVFGSERMTPAEVQDRAAAQQTPEALVGADGAASRAADQQITEAPAATPRDGTVTPPPPRGAAREPGAAGAEAPHPELAEIEARLAEARATVEAAAREAGVKLPPEDATAATQKAADYERAWKTIAECAKAKGV